MPRIPIIEQTTSVSTTTPSPQAQGQQVVSPFGNAFQIAANGLNEIAGAEVRNQNALFHKENADAVANLSKPMSDAQVYWQQQLTDGQKATVDGGMVKQPDGTLIGFRSKMQNDFDTWAKPFVDGVQNPKARQIAMEQVNHLRTRVLDNAISFEAQAGVANRSAKVDESVQNWASQAAGAKSVEDVDQLVLTAKTFIANSGFDEQTRNSKATAAVKAIVIAANQGAMERDPAGFKAAAIARYGVDPTAPNPTPGSSSAPANVTRNPDGTVSLDTDPKLPAGMRNNNPGNIIWANQKDALGPSVNRDNGGTTPQAVFATPEQGAAAMYQLALRKYDAGKTTPNDIIASQGGWTPGNKAAAANIARIMGIGADDNLNLRDPVMLKKFARALITQEHGTAGSGYSDQMLGSVADSVLAGKSVAAGPTGPGRGQSPGSPGIAPPAPAYSPAMASLVNKLPVENLPGFISGANTLVNQQQALVRSQLTVAEGDHVTAFMNGQTVPRPLTEAEYVKAYGPVDGAQRFANYQQIQQLGTDITSMKAMPPEQMQALTERYRPDPAQPGYELATKRYETILKAADQVNMARQADPMAYAMQSSIGGAKPLNFQDPKAFMAEMANRQGVAATMQQTYGAPYSLLTKAEASTLNKGFETMTTQQRLGYLNSIKTSLSDPAAYRSVMQQIAPDSPVTAMAGMILSKQQPVIVRNTFSADTVYQQQDVAGVLLEGEALLNPTKTVKGEDGKGKVFPMPKEQDFRDQFSSAVGKAFAADPRGADFAYQAVKAYYAGKSAREGDITGTLDSGRLKDAIAAVTGGVADINGKGEVLRPWGMSEARFKDEAKAAFDKAIAANGFKGSALDVYGAYGLQSAGDSKYMLRSGTGYLTSRTGAPIILDLTEKPSLVDQIPIGRSTPPLPAPATVVPEKTAKPNTQQPKTK